MKVLVLISFQSKFECNHFVMPCLHNNVLHNITNYDFIIFQCARAVQKYFQDKAAAAQKAEKAQELQLKKIAAFAAREIRTFWSNVEKVIIIILQNI